MVVMGWITDSWVTAFGERRGLRLAYATAGVSSRSESARGRGPGKSGGPKVKSNSPNNDWVGKQYLNIRENEKQRLQFDGAQLARWCAQPCKAVWLDSFGVV